ncbi:MAG: RNA polymerase sigma-70 factor [Bacteroidota bacterium]|nr:RNA polymerase sigma-70 factor [Bacteroidota bacterium]
MVYYQMGHAMKVDDDELFLRIKESDYKSYNHFFERYYCRLCAFVFKITGDSSGSEDIVQDIFIKIWTKRSCLVITESIKGYLFKTAKNSALNYLRAESNHKNALKEIVGEEIVVDDNFLENEEFRLTLDNCIDHLPDRCKEVFLMSRFNDLKQKEIATKMNISVKTIKNQIWHALKFLRSCLELKDVL